MTNSAPRYFDVSRRDLLELEGKDGLDFLQRVSTNDVLKLGIGEHVQTALTNDKGRLFDIASVFRTSETSLFLSGQRMEGSALELWLRRYIVMEDIHLTSISHDFSQFLIVNA